MNIAQALKAKNRLAGELARKQAILNRENCRRSDSTSKIDRNSLMAEICDLSEKLANLKAKIAIANVGIYPKLELMSELKSRIAYISNLPIREGEETIYGHNNEKTTYTWNSYVNHEAVDNLIADLQISVNNIQDEIDVYNATTQI